MEDTLFIEIQRLCQLVHQRGLRELSVSQPGFSLSLTALEPGAFVAAPALAPAAVSSAMAKSEVAPVPEGYAVTSPLVGIYYRSPSPDAPHFVEVGDRVEVGQVIGIVEAMKVFNEITSDRAGVVTAIPAENGKLVQVGQTLVVLDTVE